MPNNRDRWQNEFVYQIDVKYFKDSNADGYGDIGGVISELDYLKSMGVKAIWLLPFYPSQWRDNGYDIVDYFSVDSRLGDLSDYIELIEQAHSRDIKVFIDMVIHHTSNIHHWFQAGRMNDKSKFSNYYIWRDQPDYQSDSRAAFPGDEHGPWQFDERSGRYYHHSFYSFQPDLNLRNPDVHNEIKNIFDFWASLGTDGFRIDAVNYMFYDRVGAAQDNFEDGHQFFADLHRDLESTYDRQFLFFGETDLDLDAFKKYFKDLEKHDGYGIFGNLNFYVNQHLLLAYVRENTQQFINALQDMPFTDKNVWFNFIRNHDEFNTSKLSDDEQDEVLDHFDPEEKARSYGRGISRRLGPLFDYDEAKMKSIYSVLFFLPGSPVIFYGDEIGLADNIDLDERASVRTTMGWVKQQPFYGFSEYGAEKLPEKINLPKPSEPIRTVDLIEADRDSAYNWLKFLGRMRSTYQSIFGGEHQFIDTGEVAVLGSRFTDSDNHNEVLLLGNISNSERSLENLGINLSKYQIINPDFTTKLIPDDLDCLQPYQSLILIKE